MIKDIDSLSNIRKDWVEANRKNGFEEGITNLLTQLYPDNAHFIYELLQNAEDPCATEVAFRVNRKSVEFEHNGKRLFDIKDIESITSIGKSTKRDDPTSIGKFGVGFKAVFAYTNTPEIHSGKFNFKIRDLVVPERCNPKGDLEVNKTRFILPFDNSNKSPSKAVEEVEKGLKALGDNALLFLSHIRIVKYKLHDGKVGLLQRIDHESGRVEIKISFPDGKTTSSNWLRFTKDVIILDEYDNEKICKIAIAYAIKKKPKKIHESIDEDLWIIVPVSRGQVSIFFPAEKETSNLQFHIHAPFASTVARDSIRDCHENELLRDHISSLIVESLHEIRSKGMLNIDFCGVLPNTRDNLNGFYKPIRDVIVEAFNKQALTPTKSGGYAPASDLFRGPAKISSVLNDSDIIAITDYEKPFWVANPQQRNQRQDHFLESLDITEWEWSDLAHTFSPEDDECILIYNLISKKDDKWIQRLYSLLGELVDEHYYEINLENCRIVRVDNNDQVDHVVPKKAFFPFGNDVEKDLPENSFFLRKESYLKKGSSAYIISFLRSIGVKEFNARTVINLDLQDIKESPPKLDDELYFKRILRYIEYWKANPVDVDLFNTIPFLVGENKEKDLYWCKSSVLVLASPYDDNGLEFVARRSSKYIIWKGYNERLEKKVLPDFVAFMKAVGAIYQLKVFSISIYLNPKRRELISGYSTRETSTKIDEDFTIEGLGDFIKSPSVALSRTIWNCIIKADSKFKKARYRPNQQYPTREVDSLLVCNLKKFAWIPDKHGNFRKPEEICVKDLRDDFVFNDNNGFLTAIGFGDQEKKRSSAYNERDKAAREAGFDNAEEQEKWIMLKGLGLSPDDLLIQYGSHSTDATEYELPERSPGKSGIRQERLKEEASNALERDGEMRTRTVQVNKPLVKEEARRYLIDNYTNPDGSMICQICKAELPFRQRDDSFYFEAVEFFKPKKLHRQNYLSLCPNHAAMYRLVNDSESSLKTELVNIIDEVELTVVLAGDEYSIYFTEKHLKDLKIILSVDTSSITNQSIQPNDRDTSKVEAPSLNEVVSGYGGISFPTGLDTWKKGYLYQDRGKWVLASPSGKIIANFGSKSDAHSWWNKFAEYRGFESVLDLKYKRPKLNDGNTKLNTNTNIGTRSITNTKSTQTKPSKFVETGTCPRCNGSGHNGNCRKCDGTGWLD